MEHPREPDYLQKLFEAIPVPSFALDEQLRVQIQNRAASDFLGTVSKDNVRRFPGDILRCLNALEAPDGCGSGEACPDCVVRQAAQAALRGRQVFRREAALRLDLPGGVRDVALKVTASPFMVGGSVHVLLSMEDMSDAKRAEVEREEKDRLRGALEMAGAAAHEFSQPLQVILGELELALEDLSADHPLYTSLLSAMRSSERLAQTVHKVQSLTLYRTTDYLEGKRIIDLDRASRDSRA
ncbi:hypothetical protein AAU61_03380 [Desulfocarbo indianensis]|nr:hypothetical protein AAU61_03380 [Desulfocarbo indianensis]